MDKPTLLREAPFEEVWSKLKEDVKCIAPKVNTDEIPDLPLTTLLRRNSLFLKEMKKIRDSDTYCSWLKDDKFLKLSTVQNAYSLILEHRKKQIETEKLIEGETYYRNVSSMNGIVYGEKCTYGGKRSEARWHIFEESSSIMKSLLVARAGTTDDFQKLYVEMADGRADGLRTISVEHITESSPQALREMEKYCDSRWTGKWPWETPPSELMKYVIEQNEERHKMQEKHIQRSFVQALREFENAESKDLQFSQAMQEMSKTLESIIKSLGNLASKGIQMKGAAAGDGESSETLDTALGELLNNAVQAITQLKSGLDSAMSELQGGGTGDSGMVPPPEGEGDMPLDGASPEPSDVEDLASLDIAGGDPEERATKEM